ncbi:MAG: carbohydrate kinase family protein [Candidatus Pacebacteria bacterium]|nr:carbohydrate kinase family protein [Candidatus Paceibacterota bacterium]
MNVIVTGSLGYDYIMDFSGKFADRIMPEKAHKISLSFLVDSLKKQFGGTAGNIAYTLKLLGVEPSLLAPAGNDFASYREFLEKNGISTEHISVHDDVTMGSYFVVTDQEDNQIGSFYKGAIAYADQLSIETCLPADIVVISPTEPQAMKKYVKECIEDKAPYIYDPAFQIADFSAEELKEGIGGAKILIGNDYEIALIEQKLALSHDDLKKMTPILITTLGAQGSRIESDGKTLEIPIAPPTSILDPTGAGDAYRGGFLAGYLRDFDLETCGRMGAVAAAYTVEMYGTVTHTYTKEEFSKRYTDCFNIVLPKI